MKYTLYVTRFEGGYAQELGTIGYDGNISTDYENFMFFNTRDEAEYYWNKHKSEFAGDCTAVICENKE